MNYLKSMHIEGFKKFRKMDITFNEHMNILVGENEAGKSTILDAIRTVLSQQYRNADKSILKDLFNVDMVKDFQGSPSISNLPYIIIELEMELDPKQKNSEYFYGEVYGKKTSQEEKWGIRFECKFDEELGTGLEAFIADGKIPYEYYALTWETFGNKPYKMIKKPLQYLMIDTSGYETVASFNYYNRALFTSRYDNGRRMQAKNDFRDELDNAFANVHLPDIDTKRKFGVDGKKVIFETILSVYEDSVALENRGSGMESLIKTQMALDRKNGLNVIMMEEPENHLCFSNLRQMLEEISKQQEQAQIIVTTHNNMIASRLNLQNVLWVTKDDKVQSLKNVDKSDAEFFVKADDNAFLQLLLSKKAILVEGPTEFLLVPYFYQKVTGRSIEEDGITILSCNGISYKRYLSIGSSTNKRIAVITDNDKEQSKIDSAKSYNDSNTERHIFMDASTVEGWTWEAAIYKINTKVLDDLIEVQSGAKYAFHGIEYGPVLGKMLNNKVDVAYLMLTSGKDFEIPQYVKDAIEWLSK